MPLAPDLFNSGDGADVVVMVLRAGLDAVFERLGVRRKERRVGERCANRPAL